MNHPFAYSIGTRVRDRYLLEFVNPSSGDRILDVGCGVGYFCELMQNYGAQVFGIDPDVSATAWAARRRTSIRYYVGTAEALPFPANSFGKVICSEVLEHVEYDSVAIQEICRVTRPHGVVYITVPSAEGVFGSKIKNICHDDSVGAGFERHFREGYSLSELESLLSENGLLVEKVHYTLVLFAELVMGATKLLYQIKSGNRSLRSQSEVAYIGESSLFRIYGRTFPLLLSISRLEDALLSKYLRGHMIVVKASVVK